MATKASGGNFGKRKTRHKTGVFKQIQAEIEAIGVSSATVRGFKRISTEDLRCTEGWQPLLLKRSIFREARAVLELERRHIREASGIGRDAKMTFRRCLRVVLRAVRRVRYQRIFIDTLLEGVANKKSGKMLEASEASTGAPPVNGKGHRTSHEISEAPGEGTSPFAELNNLLDYLQKSPDKNDPLSKAIKESICSMQEKLNPLLAKLHDLKRISHENLSSISLLGNQFQLGHAAISQLVTGLQHSMQRIVSLLQDLPDSDDEDEEEAQTALRAELEKMNASDLRKRAVAAGVSQSLPTAVDAGDTHSAFVELVLAVEARTAGLRPELEKMSTSDLRKHALASRVSETLLVAIDDGDTKAALVEIIVVAEAAKVAQRQAKHGSSNRRGRRGALTADQSQAILTLLGDIDASLASPLSHMGRPRSDEDILSPREQSVAVRRHSKRFSTAACYQNERFVSSPRRARQSNEESLETTVAEQVGRTSEDQRAASQTSVQVDSEICIPEALDELIETFAKEGQCAGTVDHPRTQDNVPARSGYRHQAASQHQPSQDAAGQVLEQFSGRGGTKNSTISSETSLYLRAASHSSQSCQLGELLDPNGNGAKVDALGVNVPEKTQEHEVKAVEKRRTFKATECQGAVQSTGIDKANLVGDADEVCLVRRIDRSQTDAPRSNIQPSPRYELETSHACSAWRASPSAHPVDVLQLAHPESEWQALHERGRILHAKKHFRLSDLSKPQTGAQKACGVGHDEEGNSMNPLRATSPPMNLLRASSRPITDQIQRTDRKCVTAAPRRHSVELPPRSATQSQRRATHTPRAAARLVLGGGQPPVEPCSEGRGLVDARPARMRLKTASSPFRQLDPGFSRSPRVSLRPADCNAAGDYWWSEQVSQDATFVVNP